MTEKFECCITVPKTSDHDCSFVQWFGRDTSEVPASYSKLATVIIPTLFEKRI